ncbi:hypothetical protein AG1IA_03802 [Rhizoctonia solani AG-1 IA]|uniref:Uncharacterized protein n=1 Tax=Thanatephorus cucumeris (strain AG1-IA) TaxID=983506 RepID=L8WZG3_THACA|nr:hypothetical protein AG1IA_03802 [Rhizoctonia solani AG-1 IA]
MEIHSLGGDEDRARMSALMYGSMRARAVVAANETDTQGWAIFYICSCITFVYTPLIVCIALFSLLSEFVCVWGPLGLRVYQREWCDVKFSADGRFRFALPSLGYLTCVCACCAYLVCLIRYWY